MLKLFDFSRYFQEQTSCFLNSASELCIYFLFSISIPSISAQEYPPIENFSTIEYGAENQNWGLTQSEDRNIYVANNSGLLEFNGATWKLYGSPNGSSIRSVKAIDDIVFTGCYMEFGFWQKNTLGDLVYQSISNELTEPLLEDEEFWNILKVDDWVLFQSLERIYIYHSVEKSIKVLDSKSTKAQMFSYNGTVYFQKAGIGLFKIENGTTVLVSDNPIITSNIITGIFAIDNKSLLVTESGYFYFFEHEVLEQWENPFSDLASSINVYSSLQLSDGTIVLGTISNGIYHIDKQGNIQQKINQEKGLNNNTVLSIFEDQELNLWLALDNGISVINMDSPFEEYIDKNGKLGVVYASAIYKDYLYLGTNQGLFYKKTDFDGDFELIGGSQGQVWFLKIIDNLLFCGHNNGTYIIDQDSAEIISDYPGTWDIKPIPNHKNLLIQGNFKGLSVLFKNNNQWSLRNVISGFDISSRFFEFTGENQVAVNHEFKGIYKLDLDDGFIEVINSENVPSKGIGASMINFGDKILYTCDTGVYYYDSKQAKFVADTSLTNAFYNTMDNPVGIFISDEQSSRLWCFTDNNLTYAAPGKFNASSEINKISIPSSVIKNLGVLGFESLTPLSNEKYLIGISNGYLTVDLKRITSKECLININAISRRSTDSDFEKISKDGVTSFKFSQNNLLFSYNVSEFDKYTEVNYQYQLDGIYDQWSDLTSIAGTSFENLPFGNYTFNVRAKVGNDLTSNVASYSFRIERPWYLSNLAIFMYAFGLVMIALLIHRLYKNYYRKQREQLLRATKKQLKRKKLKAQKKIVQINNEKLKEEVASKNRELAISTMSIIKKNEFLNAIKDQLKTSGDNPQVKSVIKTIDQNINNVDDWKFFEDAFNNADKDFLKKIKGLHKELTSNDLRLCAYLRLNLSSKEIAPLLNISVRSVEVKRYRLRKKIDLPHEDGLADYIMQI